MNTFANNQDFLGSQGWNRQLLHPHPLCTRLMSLSGYGCVAIKKNLTNWHCNNRFINVIAGGVYIACSTLTISCAIIEHVASTTLCLGGMLANKLTNEKFVSLKKFNVQCYAYSVEILIQTALTVTRILSRIFPSNYTEVALLDHGTHFFSALIMRLTSLCIEESRLSLLERERFLNEQLPSFIQLVIEGLQDSLNDIIRASSMDLGVPNNFRGVMGGVRLSASSQDILMNVGRELNLQNLSDADYRRRVIRNLYPVIEEISRLLGVQQVGQMNAFGPQGAEEVKYQEHLIACTKEAVKLVYNNDNYWECLEGGRDAIEGFYAETTIPLASITQLIEIEKFSDSKNVKCPEKFNSRLSKYNTRYNTIKDLSEKLKILTFQEREQLTFRLLKGSEYIPTNITHKSEFDALVTGIGILGGDIHQGNLMGILKLQMSAELVQGVNMFAKAWQEAVVELRTSPIPNRNVLS